MKGKVTCTCGWSWNKSDSSKKDMYICHECGRDNSNNMKNGGWLDKHDIAQEGETLSSPPKSQYKRLYGHASEFDTGENENMRIDPNTGYGYFPIELSPNQQKEVPDSTWNTSRFLFDPFIRNVSQGIHNAKYNNKGEYIDSPGDVMEQGYFTSGMNRRERYDAAKNDITNYYKEDLKLNEYDVEKKVDDTMDLIRKMRRTEEMMQRQNQTYKNFQNPEEVFKIAVGFYGDDNEINPSEAKRAYKMFQKTWRGTSGKEARQNSREELRKAQEAFKLSKEQMKEGLPKPDPNYIPHDFANGGILKNGGWLDNYNDSKASAPEGMIGDGYSNVGRDYSPAWGGQFQNGGKATRADSLFLLKNNKIIKDLQKKGYKWNSESAISKNPNLWKKKYDNEVNKLPALIKGDIYRGYKKKPYSTYIDKRGKFVGTQDWLGMGGEDYFMPKQYIHPDIIPQFRGDLRKDKFGKVHSIESYGYDDLAVTPFDMLTPEQQKQRIKKYGTDGVPKSYLDKNKSTPNKTKKSSEDISQKREPIEALQSLQPIGIQNDFNIEASLPVLIPEAKIPKSYSVRTQRYTMEGPTEMNHLGYYNNQEATLEEVMKIQAEADAYNANIQKKYGPDLSDYNQKIRDRGEDRASKIKMEVVATPNYQMGGNVYPVNYVPRAQGGLMFEKHKKPSIVEVEQEKYIKPIYSYPKREPYPSELKFFKENTHVGGMATEDNYVIINPYSPLSDEEKGYVEKLEQARLAMRNGYERPTFEITPKQQEYFNTMNKGKPYSPDKQDILETIVSRIMVRDPTAQDYTEEQQVYADKLWDVLERSKDYADGMKGMMKSTIATQAHFGNPAALRMVSANANKYTFTGEEKKWDGTQAAPAGDTGTHFMSSFGNQARPSLQEVDGKMQYFQNPPYNSKENFNFSRPEDAEYFAKHYKEFAPMTTTFRDLNGFQTGGSIPGATGSMYARIGAPSNGPYAKKTMPSAQNGVDMYDNPMLARRVDNTNVDRSYYDPRLNTMNIGNDYNIWHDQETGELLTGDDLKYHQDKLLAHENYHAMQHSEDRDNYDIAHDTDNALWAQMQKRPELMSTNAVWNNFYNRSDIENQQDYQDMINYFPESRILNEDLLFDKVLDGARYNNPSNAEGEAKFYEDTGVGFRNGGWLDGYSDDIPKAQWGETLTPEQAKLKKEVERNNRKLETKAKWDEYFEKERKKEEAKKWVQGSMEEAYKHPLMSPGYFTPEGMAIGAMQGAVKMPGHIAEGDGWGVVGDVAMMLPFAKPAAKTLGRVLGPEEGLLSKFKPKQNYTLPEIPSELHLDVNQRGFDLARTTGNNQISDLVGRLRSNQPLEEMQIASLGKAYNSGGLSRAESELFTRYLIDRNRVTPGPPGGLFGMTAEETAEQYARMQENPMGGGTERWNVNNQLAPPPSEIRFNIDGTTENIYSARPQYTSPVPGPGGIDLRRPINGHAPGTPEWERLNNEIWESQNMIKPTLRNKSGYTKEDLLSQASSKDKDVISKMTEKEFQETVFTPKGEVLNFKPGAEIDQMVYNPTTGGSVLKDQIPLSNEKYAKVFNENIDLLNNIISKNNTSGVNYTVSELTPSGELIFNSPTGQSTWNVNIKPGQWRGEVENIANPEYYKSIPGLDMQNTTRPVFRDGIPRRGTGTYESINEYLKRLDLGRVKPGFNSQTQFSKGLWENAIKKDKAFGFYGNPGAVYGSMKSVAPYLGIGGIGAAAASQTEEEEEVPQQKQGGVIKDDRGQWNHPGEITRISGGNITMKKDPRTGKALTQPILGIADTGEEQMMYPGEDYIFEGANYVTEYPKGKKPRMAKNGLRQEQKGLQNLDNLLNFTNYNKPQPGGWLSKYE